MTATDSRAHNEALGTHTMEHRTGFVLSGLGDSFSQRRRNTVSIKFVSMKVQAVHDAFSLPQPSSSVRDEGLIRASAASSRCPS